MTKTEEKILLGTLKKWGLYEFLLKYISDYRNRYPYCDGNDGSFLKHYRYDTIVNWFMAYFLQHDICSRITVKNDPYYHMKHNLRQDLMI